MVTKFGAGGASSSRNSDTLRTIFLNPRVVGVALALDFTHLHTPKLLTSAPLYVINKEYPLGTWNTLASTSNTVYPDTLNICIAKINYQVSLKDASGCTSTSNFIAGTYTNTKAPEQPYVDSISVLPNGFTTIGWQIPLDKDIDKYTIQYLVGGTNQPIDTIKGRNSTSYTYAYPTANTAQVGLFVKALDSCGLGGTLNYQLRTMYVQTTYDRCAYQTTLKWNRYVWSDIRGVYPESTKEYRIYYSINNGGFGMVGATSDTNFIHTNVAPGKNVCYFVRVVNQRQTITASSNRRCFFSDQVEAPAYIYLKTASIVGKTSAEIKVYIDNLKSSRGITIQRSENEIDFKDVGFITSTGGAHYSFSDGKIEPAKKAYSYRALIVDSCGNTRSSSNVARTILLKVHEDDNQLFTKQLSWSDYKGFGGAVSGYNIYRILNEDISTALVGTTDALTTYFTDNLENSAPRGARIDYVVQAVEGIGNPYGIFEMSNSNAVPVYMEGTIFVPNAFAPEGVNTTWLPITHFVEKAEYHVSVFNRWGKKVFESHDDKRAWDGADCISDVYVYLIDYKNARGEYLQVKGTVSLMR